MNNHQKLSQPPLWADKLLEWLCPDNLLEEIQGDLQELFEETSNRSRRAESRQRVCTVSVGLYETVRF
jgi:hypothetical protein